MDNNISPLVVRMKENLQTWHRLPLNLLGRINIYKMIYLPRFLYLLWHAPVYIAKKVFKGINKILLSFLWGAKPARVSLDTLYLPIRAGGLALPDLLYYNATI